MGKNVYAWVAEVARSNPYVRFYPDKSPKRDGRTRINLVVNEKSRLFVVFDHFKRHKISPEEAIAWVEEQGVKVITVDHA